MSSATQPQATLVDLLDRVLDRGLVLEADIVICLAGVPLIGINLRAALAGMETMVQYGMMQDWDQAIRHRGGWSVKPTGVAECSSTVPAGVRHD